MVMKLSEAQDYCVSVYGPEVASNIKKYFNERTPGSLSPLDPELELEWSDYMRALHVCLEKDDATYRSRLEDLQRGGELYNTVYAQQPTVTKAEKLSTRAHLHSMTNNYGPEFADVMRRLMKSDGLKMLDHPETLHSSSEIRRYHFAALRNLSSPPPYLGIINEPPKGAPLNATIDMFPDTRAAA